MGVVGDVRQMGLDAPVKAEMYLPYSQVTAQPWFAPRDLVVRTSVEPMSLVAPVKLAIAAADPEQAVSNIRTFNEILDEQVVERRLGATLLTAFATLALLLASSASTASSRTSWPSTPPRSECASPWLSPWPSPAQPTPCGTSSTRLTAA